MNEQVFLRTYRIGFTLPRKQVLSTILAFRNRHFSVEDVLRRAKAKKYRVSRATVFRAIKLFSERGLLRVLDLGKEFKMYELATDSSHHDHLYCLQCGAIIEFEDKGIEQMQNKVCLIKNFRPLTHSLRIVGLCRECKRKEGEVAL